MIGLPAFLSDMAPSIIFLTIALAIAALVRKSRASDQNVGKKSVSGAIAIVVILLSLGNGAFRLSHQLTERSALRNLSSDEVSFIRVGDHVIEKTADVKVVVDKLRDLKWYVHTAGDGGWGRAEDMIVHLKSGEERRYRIGRMNKQEGAIVDFISQNASLDIISHHGYALSSGLPQALDQVGVQLPRAN
jgi:hypothetical protein